MAFVFCAIGAWFAAFRIGLPAGADHIRCAIASSDGTRLKAIAFRAMGMEMGELLMAERSFPLHIAGRLVADEWGVKRVPSVQIEDVARVG